MAKKTARKRSSLPQNSAEVWRLIVDQGGLDVDHYDTGMVDDLRRALGLPVDIDIEQALQASHVGTEELVEEFLRVAAPYGQMLVDLLAMFETADARQSNHNLRVTFDFGKLSKPLDVDLTHFREWLSVWRKVEQSVQEELWNSDSLWALNNLFRDGQRVLDNWSERVTDQAMRRWAKAYIDERQWLPELPSAPRTGIDSLDAYLARAWDVWLHVVRDTATVDAGRPLAQSAVGGGGGDLFAARELPAALLAGLENDQWAGSMAVAAYGRAEAIAADRDPEAITELESALNTLFGALPTQRATITSLLQELASLLNLPFWKRRHELYAAWVGSQIVAAAEAAGPRVLQAGGAIHFSFKGSHLATLDEYAPRLHLWAELRSPLEKPKGKGRKNAIQPDYTLAREPVTSAEASVLVVECKQYRKASISNFADALADYARGRPNAQVVLVNYGPADPNIASAVPAEERDRVAVIGRMHPGSDEAVASFRQIVAGLVGPVPCTDQSAVHPNHGRVSLTWRDRPQDLDLHLWVWGAEGFQMLNYESCAIAEAPYGITFSGDVRSGAGPEVMEIPSWMAATFLFFRVHNFSGDAPLAGCGAKLAIHVAGREIVVTCPENADGAWWDVATYDPQTGRLEVLNTIRTDPT